VFLKFLKANSSDYNSKITFTELDPTPKEKDQTKVSFEDLTIETPKTPDVVHEIIKLKQQEAEQSIKDQLPLPSRESSSFSTKDSARSSETVFWNRIRCFTG
jgi:hypothetical protein